MGMYDDVEILQNFWDMPKKPECPESRQEKEGESEADTFEWQDDISPIPNTPQREEETVAPPSTSNCERGEKCGTTTNKGEPTTPTKC